MNVLVISGMKIFRDLIYMMRGLMRNKKLRAKAGGKFTEGMIGPYKKAIEQ